LTLDIIDNGRGIDPDILSESKPTGHWGLAGMGERADSLGATLKFGAQPGGGTHVKLVIPGAVAFRHEQNASMFANFYRGLLKRLKKTG
jgi:nitrate/nitrite-specific signal transduction histidine kinase